MSDTHSCTHNFSTRSVLLVLSVFATIAGSLYAGGFPTTRDPLKWPFAQNSIWNQPIGSGAMYKPTNMIVPENVFPDENILIFAPSAPLTSIYKTTADWIADKKRCDTANIVFTQLDRVPLPVSFSTDPGYYGLTPNHAAAILMPNGRTIHQNQPFHRCGVSGTAVTGWILDSGDIFGPGTVGAHGGSRLSSIGGTIRIGELIPGGIIRHSLQFGLYGL
jgi:hypothetical protein